MPWNTNEVDGFKKGLSKKQKKKWVAIANGVLESCKEDNGKDCEGKAVRIANSKFEKNLPFNPLFPGEIGDEMKRNFEERFEPPEAGDPQNAYLNECEMEIFRAGTHNGDEFSEDDLNEIADNFKKLKNEVRPKLKITHHGDDDEQTKLAGLASYGDIVDVYVKINDDGEKRLYCKCANIPKEVMDWMRAGRFSERSIEIYPEFKIGTQKDSPIYRNVLKAVALLGHEMPAVTGMQPIRLSEFHEDQKTICFSEVCFTCFEAAEAYSNIKKFEAELTVKLATALSK